MEMMRVEILTVLLIWLVTSGQCQTFSVGVIYQTKDWQTTADDNRNLNHPSIYGSTEVTLTETDIESFDSYDFINKVCQLMDDGKTGLIAYTTCPISIVVDWWAKFLQIPLIQFTKQQCDFDVNVPTVLKFHSSCKRRNTALMDIMIYMDWIEVVIIHDEFYGSVCIQDLITQLSSIPIGAKLLYFEPHQTADDIIGKLDTSRTVKILVLVHDSKVNDLLEKAAENGLMTQSQHWVLSINGTLPEVLNLTYPNITNGLIITISQKYDSSIVNSKCTGPNIPHNLTSIINNDFLIDTQTVYLEALRRATTNSSFALGSSDCENKTQTQHGSLLNEYLKQVSFAGRTGYISFDSDGYFANTEFQICSIKEENGFDLEHVATYNNRSVLELKNDKLFQNKFTGFNNRTLKVTSVPAMPFNIKTTIDNDTFYYTGFCYEILDEFAAAFNFRYETIESIDGTYGGPTDDFTDATGMVGMVMRGEVDIGVAPFTVTAVRETVVDFLTPFQEEGIGIIMKKANSNTNRMFKMFLPFQYTVWLIIMAFILCVGIMLYIVSRYSPYNHDTDVRVYRSFWLSFGSFVGQGGESYPTMASGRIVLGMWWVFTILMVSIYTANLAAFLTVSLAKAPIKNLNELASQTEYKPLVKSGSNLIALFKFSTSGVYSKIWSMMTNMPTIKSAEAAYELVESSSYAYMTDVSQLEYKVMTDCQNLEVAEETFNKAGLSFIVKENSPYLEAFNQHMNRMLEAGLIQKFRRNWWPTVSDCSDSGSATSAHELHLESMAGLFFVYLGVIAFSILLFIVELLVFRILYLKCRRDRVNSTTDLQDNTSGTIVSPVKTFL